MKKKQQFSTQQISCWKSSLSAHAFNPKSLDFKNGFSKLNDLSMKNKEDFKQKMA